MSQLKLPSQFQIGDRVYRNDSLNVISRSSCPDEGIIIAVKFTESKVRYDILDPRDSYLWKEIDSERIWSKSQQESHRDKMDERTGIKASPKVDGKS